MMATLQASCGLAHLHRRSYPLPTTNGFFVVRRCRDADTAGSVDSRLAASQEGGRHRGQETGGGRGRGLSGVIGGRVASPAMRVSVNSLGYRRDANRRWRRTPRAARFWVIATDASGKATACGWCRWRARAAYSDDGPEHDVHNALGGRRKAVSYAHARGLRRSAWRGSCASMDCFVAHGFADAAVGSGWVARPCIVFARARRPQPRKRRVASRPRAFAARCSRWHSPRQKKRENKARITTGFPT